MTELRVETTSEDDAEVLRVSGTVDLESSPRLWDAIEPRLTKAPDLVVDLSQVGFIDSSGIAILIRGFKHAQKHGIGFRLRAPSDQVRAVLELSQLTRLFQIEGRP